MNNRQKLSTDQRGIMAIVVTVLIMTVLSITTLAMAKMARREQRQSLDATMSVQANYAVESGINDSVAYLNDPLNPAISACTGATGAGSVNKTLASDGQQLGNTMKIPAFVSKNDAVPTLALGGYTVTTSYTCALISKTTKELKYTVNSSSVADITVGTAQTTLTIGWDDENTNFRTGATCAQSLPTSWVNLSGSPFTPMLRVDITNLSVASPYFRKTMADNTGTIYLNPCASGAGTGTFARGYDVSTTNPQIINGSCSTTNTPRKCTATITMPSYTRLLVRLHSVYGGAANVSISAAGQDISGAQTIIDVTAKSNDVVKRVRKTFSTNPTGSLTDDQPYLYAIQSQYAICKRLRAGEYNFYLNRYGNGTFFDSINVSQFDIDSKVCDPT